MTFRVGQVVECVNDSAEKWNGYDGYPIVKNQRYMVRCIGLTFSGAPGIKVDGVLLSSPPGTIGLTSKAPFVDAFFRADRFRPIVERKTSIEIFTRMLNSSKQDANA